MEENVRVNQELMHVMKRRVFLKTVRDFGTALIAMFGQPCVNPREPLASPLFADLSGLAPLMVHAAEREVLVDDARALVAGVLAAGGRANLEIWPDLMHFWHLFVPDVPESTAAVLGVAEFLLTYIGA